MPHPRKHRPSTSLKQLALQRVSISEHSLHSLIAGCPILECLLIHYSMGFSCARINSLSLRSIGVLVGWRWSDEPHFKELVIENAPRLERLLRPDLLDGLHVSVISAPKLESLGCLGSADYYRSTVIQGLHVDSLMSVVHTLKVLAFDMSPLDLDMVLELMRCFTCLEKLYIYNKSRHGLGKRPRNFWRRKHQNLHINPKQIVLESYWGIKSEVNFANFFVLNARVLQPGLTVGTLRFRSRLVWRSPQAEIVSYVGSPNGLLSLFHISRMKRCPSSAGNTLIFFCRFVNFMRGC